MRPIKLYLHGFNSFYRPAEIDFEALSEGGVFGIFGNTGSGKSTIVDAIVYALYGATDDKALDSVDYINRRMNKAEVRLTFALAEPDGSYRYYEAARTIAVDRVKNAARPAKAELFDVTDARVSIALGVRDVNAKIAELVGLDLREFSNCIILEQNEYDKFVKATDAERKSIVGSLFGLQKFGPALQEKLRERETALALESARVKERLGLMSATPETLGEAEAELSAVEEAFRAAAAREQELGAVIERGRADAERFRQKRDLEQKRIDYGERADRARKEETEAEKAYRAYAAEAEIAIAGARAAIEDCTRRAAVLEAVKDTDARIAEYDAAIRRATEDGAAAAAELAERDAAERRLADEIAAREANKRAGIARFAELTGVALAEEDARESELTETVASYVRDYDEAVRRYGACNETVVAERRAEEEANERLAEYRNELERLSSRVEFAQKTCEAARRECEAARVAREDAQKRHLAAALSEGLAVGDACPVCGAQISAPIAHAEPALAQKEAAEAAARELLTASEKAAATAAEERHKLDALYLATEENRKTHAAAREQAERTRAQSGLDDGCAARLEALRDVERKFGALLRQLSDKRTQRTLNAGAAKLARQNRARAEQAAATAQQGRAAETARRAAVAGGESVEVALAAVKRSREAAETALAELEKGAEERRAAAERAASLRRTAEAMLAETEAECAKLGTVRFDADVYERNAAALSVLRAEKENLAARRATLSGECARRKAELERRKEALKEKAELDRCEALYDRIRKMTRGGALMEWLAEEYIQDFTRLASEKLYALTDGELELKYTAKGFFVTDNFNDREERKVATVSGGETFLVSLSLAVAIAAKLEERAGARRVEFLFIDEGFGTLSQDKIDAVMDALSALGRDRFTVGFISHVAEMRQRIVRKLIVRREDAEIGSTVEPV